jgi:hypothetical protein
MRANCLLAQVVSFLQVHPDTASTYFVSLVLRIQYKQKTKGLGLTTDQKRPDGSSVDLDGSEKQEFGPKMSSCNHECNMRDLV